MLQSLSVQTAIAGLKVIARLGHVGFLEGIGISNKDYQHLTSEEPWTGSDRPRMTAMLHALANGSLTSLGMEPFPLPAEYLAAVICTFVKPSNIFGACRFVPVAISNEDQAQGKTILSAPKIESGQIFALCQDLLRDGNPDQARMQFERKVGILKDREGNKNG